MQWNEFCFHIRHLPTGDQKVIQKAFDFGAKAHAHQTRQSGEPYFSHPIAVAQILANMGADMQTIAAALLHDTVEDTEVTLPDLEQLFGSSIAALVDGVTKLNEKDLGDHSSLDEQIETLRKVFILMQKDTRIMVIKLADRLHNMQTISFRSEEKQRTVSRETMDVYVKIADRLCMRDIRDDLEQLCLSVLEPSIFPKLLELRKRNEEQSKPIMTLMETTLTDKFVTLPFKIECEAKSWDNLRHQMEMKEKGSQKNISITIVVLCKDIDTCYHTLGMLHQTWQREFLSFDDFINAPILNGYKGLHTTLILENGVRARCKIRTDEMHTYAHKGITMLCFDSQSKGILDYLPWTSHISSLSKDTEARSKEFWQSLQNDILGESNLIHGADNQTQRLPKGATALDAMFYLYGEQGLFTKQIFINGNAVPFYEEVPYASTVHASFAGTSQVHLKWLQYTHSGIGTAFIRKGLEQQDYAVKLESGKVQLELYLLSHRRGFLSEFEPHYLSHTLHTQGYPSIDDVYVQIAEGRVSPQEIERIIFRTPADISIIKTRHSYTLDSTIPIGSKRAFYDVLQYYTVKQDRMISETATVSVHRIILLLSDEEYESLQLTLDELVDQTYHIRRSNAFFTMSITSMILFFLWGIDPTIAHLLLQQEGVHPIDLTIIRFFSLLTLSGLFLLWMRRKQPLPEARLSLRNPSLWFSVFFLFCVSVTTYYSLSATLPSHYSIPMTSAGLLITTIFHRKRKWIFLTTWSLVLTGIVLLIALSSQWHMQDIIFTLFAIMSFTMFTLISERYKREEKVSLRAAQYFFMLAAFCALLSLLLLPFASLGDIKPAVLGEIILFSMFISALPYYIWYYLLSHREIDIAIRNSFLIIPMTMISEIVLIGSPAWYTYIAAILVTIGAILPLLRMEK